jgi:Family of unknown function (DUF5996)
MTPEAWPPLPYEDWKPTKETLHRYAQIVGKIRMSLVPFRNHWWHVTLYPSVRGLTTGPMPYGEMTVEIEFDFVDHHLELRTSAGRTTGFALLDGLTCASFHQSVFAGLSELGVQAQIRAVPFDLGDSPPFAQDNIHQSYDAGFVERWWRILLLNTAVLARFASRFNGKASPTQLFWHSFDLAHARFSGRRAPALAGVDEVTAEAYSHEVIAFGWWPGDERRTPYPAYYSYTAPEPATLTVHPLALEAARWQDTGNGSLAILEYDAVRAAENPAGMLLDFFQSAYDAGTTAAGWDATATDTGRR